MQTCAAVCYLNEEAERESERERDRMSKKFRAFFCDDECSHKAIVEPAKKGRLPRLPKRPKPPTRYQALQNDKKCTNSLFFPLLFSPLSSFLSHSARQTRSTSHAHTHTHTHTHTHHTCVHTHTHACTLTHTHAHSHTDGYKEHFT